MHSGTMGRHAFWVICLLGASTFALVAMSAPGRAQDASTPAGIEPPRIAPPPLQPPLPAPPAAPLAPLVPVPGSALLTSPDSGNVAPVASPAVAGPVSKAKVYGPPDPNA